MKLSDSEKLILTFLSDISLHLDIDETESGISPRVVTNAISSENEWALLLEYDNLFNFDSKLPDYIKELLGILDMWAVVEYSYENLSKEDKDKVRSQISDNQVGFRGFNKEKEYKYFKAVKFIGEYINGKYKFLGDRYKNESPSPKLSKYKAMKSTFNTVQENGMKETPFTADQIVKIINS